MAAASGSGASLTSPSRMRKIDVIREKNIAQLPLPQLVAVGDQSSGKSSLLESITGIPFPRGQELCTRYATQITHRRDEDLRIDVGIIPGPHASPEHEAKLKSFHRMFESNKALLDEFPKLLNEVNAAMNIRTKDNPTGIHTFSEDVLKIEKCGPNEDYLTVIDVPGIFRATAEGITGQDRDLVKHMVERYIKDDRTIILAVIPANVDVATQEILELAKKYDKTGDRTLGVLTKPDTVTEKSQKTSVCNLVLGKRMPLTLGYFVVRNRGGDDEDADADADIDFAERERMFAEEPWNLLPSDRKGILALRERLKELLGQITDKAFPKVVAEIRGLLKDAKQKHNALGQPRNTERDQQIYLLEVVTKFQRLVRDALTANYSFDPAFETTQDLRLITTIRNMTADFTRDFAKLSHSHRFKTIGKEVTLGFNGGIDIAPITATSSPSHCKDAADVCPMRSDILALVEYPELSDIIVTDQKFEQPQDDIMEWIAKLRVRSRGFELGTFGSTMLASAFREQSQKWQGLAAQYISKVILAVHRFIHAALEIACPDSRSREGLKSLIMEGLLERYAEGLEKATTLVAVERDGKPYTLSEAFNQTLQSSRGQRVADSLASKARKEERTSKIVVDHSLIKTAILDRGNDDFEEEDIHDILQAYYSVARKRFVDNIWLQAVDHVLLSGPMSPLKLLSEKWVMGLDNDQLQTLAGELRSVTDRRKALEKEILNLNKAVKVVLR
ncbi:P-loop containing nucleoside triphosphate hydrolase protein [Podospora aff. communis PSN243]|uniref:P-loop containing nucleoside triphosphate hydrolase protein n=1 Tax=Podospora aff. communis PSN243 TaxID=3040156 RepID=A0AAV9GLB0_9PEZI|nr:P-loop containing nucleoside triphosphate hydrolase protein [Podospora aff. communis PSN243]